MARFLLIALVVIATMLGPLQSSAQTVTGAIYGNVTDASGAVIPGAALTATDVATGISHKVASNGLGEYVFPALNPGNYSVSVSAKGFQSETTQGVMLSANQNAHVNFALQVGSIQQTITISADTVMVDTREAQVSQTVEQRRIEELPLNGRDAYDLVTLAPGITNYSADTDTGSREGVQFSANGLPTNMENFYLDGTDDLAFYQNGGNLMPNPDALQEFRLLTGNFDAEFGREPGAVVNAITRSGTKDLHGMVYEYLRNDIFNAGNYFLTGVTPLKQNQFGGNLGGPVFKHKPLFYFASYEHYLEHTPASVSATAITTANSYERNGDFSHDSSSIISKISLPSGTNCGTKAAPVICSASLDPVAQNLLKYVPVENLAGTSTTQQNATGDTSANQGLGRVDYQLSSTHSLEALFFNSRGLIIAPTTGNNKIVSYSGMSQYEGQVNAALVDTWTPSSVLVNNVRGFYVENHYNIANLFQNHMLADLGSNIAEGGAIYGPPYFSITGYWTMGTSGAGPSNIAQQSLGVIDTANLTRGRHEIKLGASYIWNKYSEDGASSASGSFLFSGGTTGNGLADFLLGRSSSFTQSTSTHRRNHGVDPAIFAQDDWQITHRLNLNLGVRWEVMGPMVGDPYYGTFHPGVQSQKFPTAPLGLLFQGDPGVPTGVRKRAYNLFAPRIGFAYDVFGKGSTSLRGGFGIFYQLAQEDTTGNLQDEPYIYNTTTANTPNLVNPYSPNADPFPYTVSTTNPNFVQNATIHSAPFNGRSTGYVEEYNMTIEQQIHRDWVFALGYVGNTARALGISRDINEPTYSSSCTAAKCTASAALINARRPYEPTTNIYGYIYMVDQAENFNYNSLQTTLKGRLKPYLDLETAYVWSKGMSNEGPSVNSLDLSLNRGRASTDVPQVFHASVLYSLPSVNYWGFAGKYMLSGWQLNGITYLTSGGEFTMISGTDTNFDNTVNDHSDIVGEPYTHATSRSNKILHYLNPSAFATPSGPNGDEQRDFLIGPKYFSTNLSAFKMIPLTHEGKLRLQFRAEAFNAFNNVNLSTPVANQKTLNTRNSSGAQQITSIVGSPRKLQFALKLLF